MTSKCSVVKTSGDDAICSGSVEVSLDAGKYNIYGLLEAGLVPAWLESLRGSIESGSIIEIPRDQNTYVVSIGDGKLCVQGIEQGGDVPAVWKPFCVETGKDLKGRFVVSSNLDALEKYNAVRVKTSGNSVGCEQFVLGDNSYKTRSCDDRKLDFETQAFKIKTGEAELIVTGEKDERPKVKVTLVIETDKGTFETKPFDWQDEKVLTKDDFVAAGPWEQPVP